MSKIELTRCDCCLNEKATFGFTHFTSSETSTTETLCPPCFNIKAAARMGVPPPSPSEFLPLTLADVFGKQHTLHFLVRLSTGLEIRAFEIVNGLPGGYQFQVLSPPANSSQMAYEKLVAKIKSSLRIKYLQSSDFGYDAENRLYVKGTAVNGRIEEREDKSGELRPTVVIDGQEYSWEELGKFLSPHNGFNFRLECFDLADDPPKESTPKRTDLCWWLDRPKLPENEKTYN